MITFEQYKVEYEALNARLKAASDRMAEFPKGPRGLTPDHVKRSPEWRAAQRAWELASQDSRAFNQRYGKMFKKERAEMFQAARESKLAYSHR